LARYSFWRAVRRNRLAPASPIIIEPNHIGRTCVSAAIAASAIATCNRAMSAKRQQMIGFG
jgi:hypothetical protein